MRRCEGPCCANQRLALVGILLLACAPAGDDAALTTTGCHPLATTGCFSPWPSMWYTEAASTATGVRVSLPDGAPKNIDGILAEPGLLGRWDGFSPSGPVLLWHAKGISREGLPSYATPEASLAADAPVVLYALDTGARVPYWAEVDQNVTEASARALIVRPMVRLAPATRYGVVVRRSVRDANGAALASPPRFATLATGPLPTDARTRVLAEGVRRVMAQLPAGVSAADVVMAWDFVTASEAMLTADLSEMRTRAREAMAAAAPVLTLQPLPADGAWLRLKGTYRAPNFLSADEQLNSVLRRDAVGQPVLAGWREAKVELMVPSCVTQQTLPRPVVLVGHGIFGNGPGYLRERAVTALAARRCAVMVAGEWIGLTDRQLALPALAANDINKAPYMTEKLAQAVIDHLALVAAIRTALPNLPAMQHQGRPVVDGQQLSYFGISLGGIMGQVLMAHEPSLTRGALAVAAGGWALMFERSTAWKLLQGAALGAYPEATDYQLLIAWLGMAIEPYDAITVAPQLGASLAAQRQAVLLWQAQGDAYVSNRATETLARSLGLPVLAPSVAQPWGLGTAVNATSALVIYDEHPTPLPSATNVPPQDNGTHMSVSRRGAAQRQLAGFLESGQVAPTCLREGVAVPCDCATGACE